MNRWKIAFWVVVGCFVFISLFGFYTIIDQGVSLTYMKDGYSATESDFNYLIKLINNKVIHKEDARAMFSDYKLKDYIELNPDTFSLERINLIFSNDSLIKIERQW